MWTGVAGYVGLCADPDMALNNLQSFAALLASEEPYLDLFRKNKTLIPTLADIFSRSEYLSKTIMKRSEYLELIGHEMFSKKSLTRLKKELGETVTSGMSLSDSTRIIRQHEEICLGILFLERTIDVTMLVRGLSRTAEAVVSVCTDELTKSSFAVIGMGKAGGRELTFGSDLDLIFVCKDESADNHTRSAERLIGLLTSYTKNGIAYRVDMRLRPDGAKGSLISTLLALRHYYSSAAQFWEFQALLKARPMSGEKTTGRCFMVMREEVLKSKGREVSASDIRAMRERILRELSKEKDGYDLKLGPGGISELEFTIQYLQLVNCAGHAGLLVQGSLDAIRKLASAGVIDLKDADAMRAAYVFYRTLESFLRLRGESILLKTGTAIEEASDFMGYRGSDEFLRALEKKRTFVKDVFVKYV